MTSLHLALKLLRREWRSGELRILIIALLIAVSCMTSIHLLAERIHKGLTGQASELLGGDAALTSSHPIPAHWLKEAKDRHLNTTQALVFFSMLSAHQTVQLASIKAVDTDYPLKGQIKTTLGDYPNPTHSHAGEWKREETTTILPEPNTIWLEASLLSLLHAQLGDTLTLGTARFKITRLLTYQPDSPGGIFSFSPKALISLSDVPKTQVIQPGSRIEYTALFSGEQKNLDQFTRWIKPLLEPGQKWISASESRPSLQANLDRVQHYLGLGSLMSVILAGVALAVALKRFTRRQFDQVALLRCYGASRKQILSIYLYLLFFVGLFSLIVACAVGYGMHTILAKILSTFLQISLPAAGLSGMWFGVIAGFWVLLAFGLPPLWQLTRVSPLQVIRRELVPLPISSIGLYSSGFLAIAVLIVWYIRDTRLTLIILGSCLIAFGIFIVSASLLIGFTRTLCKKKVGVAWRYGLANLGRHRQNSILQITAFGLTLMVLFLLIIVRYDLITAWQNELPPDAPNYFLINIAPEEVESVKSTLHKELEVEKEQIFPMIKGRLYELNQKPILDTLPASKRQEESLNRELNLSWSNTLPHNNQVISGRWWQPGDTDVASVEQGLANRLGLKLGDTLGFRVGAQTLRAKIISFRQLNWSSLQPNFYVLFPPGMLENYPCTYITSFYLSGKKGTATPYDLIQRFPNLTLIPVAEILKQIQHLLNQAGSAIQYLFFFALLAGIVVLYASIYATLDQRLLESAILRALGASRYQILSSLIAEFTTLGSLSGLLAALMANGIGIALGRFLFDLQLGFNVNLLVLGVVTGIVVIGGVGIFAARMVLWQSPLLTLRTAPLQ